VPFDLLDALGELERRTILRFKSIPFGGAILQT
jgi:hypothetical protein